MHASGFGQALRLQRLALGLTQEELAERASLSVRAISDLERGVKHAPRASTLRLLVKGMRLRADDADRLFQAAHAAVPAQASRSTRAVARHNLPIAISSFVGRERSIGELEELMNEARL